MNSLASEAAPPVADLTSIYSIGWPLLAALGLLIICAGCSAAEITIFSLTPSHLDQAHISRRRRLKNLKAIFANPGPLFLALTVVRILSQIGVALLSLTIASRVMPTNSPWQTILIAALIAFLALTLFGEFLPKAAVMDTSLQFAARLSTPLLIFARWLGPLPKLFFSIAEKAFPPDARQTEFVADFLARAQLKGLIDRGEVEGLLDDRERELISDIFEFRLSTVDQIMIPRPLIEVLPDSLSHEEMLATCRQTRHSRIPIFRDTVDQIIAVVHVKEILANPETPYTNFFREPLFVPEKCDLTDLLAEFQKRRMHLALVVDEYGGISGAVSLADLLKEITSSFVTVEKSTAIRSVGINRWVVRGDCEIFDFNDLLEAELPDRTSRTIGGFLTETLGRFPNPQEVIEYDNLRFTVLRIQSHRVALVKVSRQTDADETGQLQKSTSDQEQERS
ncbi:hypothetical protein CVU37_11220 [candidate division BRC1 bacterium HGW-BRC1-1]|jgi:CBS domain containing-hemolysin-like protein|nr:MAG: hypothetical protein CVU37_11220 [candidate division BRC1 bacterium HGW-BRC1-1]